MPLRRQAVGTISGVRLNWPGVLFIIFGGLTIGCALAVILVRNPIASVMSLVATFFFLAAIYVLLWAHTIAILQVLVYAGAIMVLFLFVIMLLTSNEPMRQFNFSVGRVAGVGGTVALFATLFIVFIRRTDVGPAWESDAAKVAAFGTIKSVGEIIYTQWLFPFEAVSILLLVAILGAIIVAKAKV